jgi:hypothetical protein
MSKENKVVFRPPSPRRGSDPHKVGNPPHLGCPRPQGCLVHIQNSSARNDVLHPSPRQTCTCIMYKIYIRCRDYISRNAVWKYWCCSCVTFGAMNVQLCSASSL